MSSEYEQDEQLEQSSNAPKSRTWYLYIDNQNPANVPVVVVAPGGGRTTLASGGTYSSVARGAHTVVAPGTPDVVYFKVNYVDYGDMSTQQGPLNGNFTVRITMR